MPSNLLDEFLQSVDPIDAATLFAGVRSAVPLGMMFRSGELNAGEDAELARRRGPTPPPAPRQRTFEDEQREFEAQFPDPAVRRAVLAELIAQRTQPYHPATATRRKDFEAAPEGARQSVQAAPRKKMATGGTVQNFNKGGRALKTLDQMAAELASKSAKPAANARPLPKAMPSGLSVDKLAQSLGVKVDDAPNVLPPKQRDKNLAKFVKPSAVQQRVFHGSNVPEGIVEDKQFAHYGPGSSEIHWFSESPEHANEYTTKYLESEGDQGAIFPANLRITNPVDLPFNMNQRADRAFKDHIRKMGIYPSEIEEWAELNDLSKPSKVWQFVNTPVFREIAQRRGFDGVKAQERDFTTWGAFEPTQIKSQFNRGTYDVQDPDPGFNKGGSVKKTLDQMQAELFKKGTKVADKPDLSRRSFFGLGAQPSFPLANIDTKALEKMQQELKGAPSITEKSVTVDPGKGGVSETIKSVAATPMSRRSVLQTAAGQVMRGALPDMTGLGALGDVAKAAESVAPAVASNLTKADIPGLVALAIKNGMTSEEAVQFVSSKFAKPPKFGGILARGEDPAEYLTQHIENLYDTFSEPWINYNPDAVGAVRPGKAFQELIGREDERLKPLALKPIMRGLQQADPQKYSDLVKAAKDRSMASVETLLSYPDVDPSVIERWMKGELRSLPPSYRDKLGYGDDF
jgi:hypothetical protein